MSSPRVSVVMPVRNAASTVVRAIESVRAQTLADWELIVVDDGSSDDTPAAIQALGREDRRIRLHRFAGRGLVGALNAGLERAQGELIARMDADDECFPERLAAQVAFLEARPDVGLAGCGVEFGGDRDAQSGYALHVDWLNSLTTPEEIALNRFIESPLAHPSVMFRRALVARLGGYRDGPFPEDYELWLRWLEAGVRMARVPAVLLRWNDDPARLSRTDPRYGVEAFYACKSPYLARWLQARMAPSCQLLIWGAGRPTRRRAELLCVHGVRIAGYVDIDARKIGRRYRSRPVFGPDALRGGSGVFVAGYVANRGAREFIRGQLCRHGFVEGVDFLMAA